LADESSAKSGVQSVERAFELLEIMASSGGSIALGELAARAELPQPTIHRLVRTLLSMGYVRQLENRRYALGPKLIRLGESAAQLIGAWSRPHLTELVERTGESANMAVLDNDMAVYDTGRADSGYRAEPVPRLRRRRGRAGDRRPVFCGTCPGRPHPDRDLDLGTGSASHPEVGDQSDAAAEARRPRYRLGVRQRGRGLAE